MYNKKIKVLKANTKSHYSLEVKSNPLKEVGSITYLGSVMDSQCGSEQDIICRIGKSKNNLQNNDLSEEQTH